MGDDEGVTITLAFGEAAKGARDRIDETMDGDAGKKPKDEVNYRPADGEDRCVKCQHWQGSDQDDEAGCAIVAGSVEAGYVSDMFEADDSPDPRARRRPPPFGDDDKET